jgi:hypothetical protein
MKLIWRGDVSLLFKVASWIKYERARGKVEVCAILRSCFPTEHIRSKQVELFLGGANRWILKFLNKLAHASYTRTSKTNTQIKAAKFLHLSATRLAPFYLPKNFLFSSARICL